MKRCAPPPTFSRINPFSCPYSQQNSKLTKKKKLTEKEKLALLTTSLLVLLNSLSVSLSCCAIRWNMAKEGEDIDVGGGELLANRSRLHEAIDIQPMIKVIRGQQVLLDRDLAMLYGVETKRLNEQVKRNIERFPDDFVFQLNNKEFEDWKSQFATSNSIIMGARKLPYAFTENGVAMLSGVLRSKTAIEANIRIMRAFVSMRRFLATNAQLFRRLETVEYRQLEMQHHQEISDKRIDEVFKRLDADILPVQGIFYDGQVFDAYRFVSDLIRKAKRSVVLFDNYVDDTVLTLLDKREEGVSATIYTRNVNNQFLLDLDRHNAQYPHIAIERFNNAHDRFLLIDDDVFHIGASIKDLGKKWFGFTLMHDITAMELVNKVKN